MLPSVCGYARSLQMEGSPVFALVLEDTQIHPFIYVRIVRSMVADYDVQSFRTLQAAIFKQLNPNLKLRPENPKQYKSMSTYKDCRSKKNSTIRT